MHKTIFIETLAEGDQLEELFMVKSMRRGETRAGKPYLSLTFSDKSGEIGGPAWDNVETLEKLCVPGTVVRVRGLVQSYRDRLQLKLDTVEAADSSEYGMDAFVAASQRDSGSMQSELEFLIDSVGDSFIRKLLERIFIVSDAGENFQTAPAAKGIHHAYLGGLLEHSLSMAQVASMLAGHYRGIDRDLLVAGALLHDIGKIEELNNNVGVIDYTDVGRLKGHLVIGCELVGNMAREIKDFPADRLTHLQHLVLSHHGRQEFGSPVVPMTAEALLLSFIDDMDSKMNLVEQLSRKMKSESAQWSDYQRSLERYILLKPLAEQGNASGSAVSEETPAKKQQSLF